MSAYERFERSNASEIRNGIMFDFYPGLPHVGFHNVLHAIDKNKKLLNRYH